MVWIIVWAGLLIVVLYSPVGSPDLYSSRNYLFDSRPVAFKSEAYIHSSKQNVSSESNDEGLSIPDINTGLTSNYAVGSSQPDHASNQGSSYGTNGNSSYEKSNSSTGGLSEGGISLISSRGSGTSAGSSGVVMTNGITTLSLTSTGNNTTNRQSAKADTPLSGGTDPGGDPNGPPIPVGEGYELLILFGMCYAIFKKLL